MVLGWVPGLLLAATALPQQALAQAAATPTTPAVDYSDQVVVKGFDPHTDTPDFTNYSQWSESVLPQWAQLAHCGSTLSDHWE
jgi:hypothetical protein